MSTLVQPLRTISTQIPARLDRLPWSRFHWRVVAALGAVWILDGLEVMIVGSIGARLTEHGSGISMTASSIGTAAAVYVAGACCGALFFGQLTDRFGRKRLMMLTLGLYIVATVTTAFAFAPWFFFLCRFFTGAGIGGEYAAINSAIDELIPARNRGQVDITINGSYLVGSGVGGLASLLFLDQAIFATDFGWRLAFGMGALLGLLILFLRRTLPESPRWLVIHGREQEAERIVAGIEDGVRAETHRELAEPSASITVRQRASGADTDVTRAQAEMYDAWAHMHVARAHAHQSRAQGNTHNASRHDRDADRRQEGALAAEQHVDAARHRAAVQALQSEEGATAATQAAREQAADRDRGADERDERIRARLARRNARERQALRRFLPGPGGTLYSPGMVGTASRWAPTAEHDLDGEIEAIARALDERGPTDRDELSALVGARYWGPGRFRAALREAVDEGRAQRLSRSTYAPAEPTAALPRR